VTAEQRGAAESSAFVSSVFIVFLSARLTASVSHETRTPQCGKRMSTHIRIKCLNCGKTLNVPKSSIGKTGKCPGCKSDVTVEAPRKRPKPKPTPRAEPEPEVIDTPLDQQPTHREEIGRDRNRMMSAVAVAPDKFELIEPYLMDYEQPVAIAVQRQFPFSVFADVVLLSSHRVLMFKRFFTKIDMFDVNYVDFKDVTIHQGFFTSSLTVQTDDRRNCTVSYLITDQALNVYRLCQDIETKARIARRQFELEENRSRTTQMHINNNLPTPQHLPQPQQPMRHLGQQDISNIGDEETDPFRLGE
jgi:hypothetical protein